MIPENGEIGKSDQAFSSKHINHIDLIGNKRYIGIRNWDAILYRKQKGFHFLRKACGHLV